MKGKYEGDLNYDQLKGTILDDGITSVTSNHLVQWLSKRKSDVSPRGYVPPRKRTFKM